MEAKELRLNNYVFGIYIEKTENADIEEKCICSVDVIDGVGCTEYNIWASSIEDKGKLIEEWERFEPIPLTEKWLLDFGYEKTDDFGDQIYFEPKNRGKRNYYVCFDHDDISFGIVVFGNCTNLMYDDKNLQYVHQFQNLIFALTGNQNLTIE